MGAPDGRSLDETRLAPAALSVSILVSTIISAVVAFRTPPEPG